ncbi:hypothetical protein [Streptomyces scopuliridis]|uniref:Uncharacterized protein n=1 Tax=Streptomyces scopuliridis TaxID=452529 RepID=A0ACD4ZQM2_9ACTN|nr:hypothetical protein [Streptomyces scopuliridis]WSC00103.1 hypothetical protein OG835_25965 [Streptomyces scopuliridis]
MNDTLFDLVDIQPTQCARCADRAAEVIVTGHPNLLGGLVDGYAEFRPRPIGGIAWTAHTAPVDCCTRCAQHLAWAWNAPYELAHPHQERIVVMAVPLETAVTA